ncbi:MAG: glycosyltransferase [Elusimicrobia bacterium]|nr:glycosyltransferase [Elusimicrobiota bacterium]
MPPPAARPALSVIILGTRRAALARCLQSLAAARGPRPAEVVVVLNGAPGVSLADLAPWRRSLALCVLAMPAAPLGRARNAALRVTRGEVVLFLDDDVVVPPDFLENLARKASEYPAAAALGGPNRTPPGSPRFARWAGALLSSAAGAGPMRRRYAGFPVDTWADDASLMLCNLAVRRSALEEEGLEFPEHLDRNEENFLLDGLRRRGRRALHSPDLAVDHERRATLRGFLRQCALSGLGRGQMTRRAPFSLRPHHAAPLVLVCAAAAAGPLRPGGVALTAAYALLAAVSAWSAQRGFVDRAAVACLMPAAHLAYAAGFAAGLAGARTR